jgi:hypothetical protein
LNDPKLSKKSPTKDKIAVHRTMESTIPMPSVINQAIARFLYDFFLLVAATTIAYIMLTSGIHDSIRNSRFIPIDTGSFSPETGG